MLQPRCREIVGEIARDLEAKLFQTRSVAAGLPKIPGDMRLQLSDAGSRISQGKDVGSTAGAQAAVGAGKAANCPHMTKAQAMPRNPNDVVNAHTPAGLSE